MKNNHHQIIILVFIVLSAHGYIYANEGQKLPISGQVVDYMARPVEGAEVVVIELEYNYSSHGERLAKVASPVIKTKRNGQFETQADIKSQYNTFIVARKDGMAYAWDGLNYNMSTKGKGHFLLVLEKACTLTGKVVDDKGNAVPGVSVQAIPKTSYMYRLYQRPIFGPKEWFTTKTDPNGIFTFAQFAADVSSDFYVKAPELNCTYKYTTHFSASCGFEVWQEDIQLALPQEGKIKGSVVEAQTGRPVAGVELLLKADRDRENILNRYIPIKIITGPDGSFVCDGLPEGKNIIELVKNDTQTANWVAEPVKFNVSPNQITENIRISVQKGGIVEYTVRQYDTGQPLPEITVASFNTKFSAGIKTNRRGIARQRMLPGRYQYVAGGKDYITWRSNQPIRVRNGGLTRVNIELTKSPTVSGTVIGLDGRPPVEDILVTVQPCGDQVYTDKEGRFVAGYDPGRVSKGLLYIIAMDTQHSLAAAVRTRTSNSKREVKLSLSPALTVKGKIADPNGIGIPAARMSLGILFDGFSELGTEVLANAQGLFEFKAIPPKQDDFSFWTDIHSAGFASKKYEKIAIQGKPGTTIDLGTISLKPKNLSVSGTVEDVNGSPRPRAVVFGGGRSVVTNEQGQFIIKGVSEGPIRIQANYSSSSGGKGITKAHAGDQNIKVVLGQKLVHTIDQSLIGKALPDLTPFNLKLDPKWIENKRILICFWDVNQRPSRNCILTLNKRAQQLLNQDVYMVFIQAGPKDEQNFISWLKKNQIAPPVGAGEEDLLRLDPAWCVQSLPWLILTDKSHIVTDEGFSINELVEKI